jgi:type I restriction enzyme S subunit
MTVQITNPTIRNVAINNRDQYVLRRGDLVLEKSGGGDKQPVGFVVLYTDDTPAVCSNFTARIELGSGMSPSYWRYVHGAAYAFGLTYRSIKQTSGIQNLDQNSYLGERAPFPPPGEQRAIATYLEGETARIDTLIEEQQRLIELLEEKRQAVISHAVTKGLDPDVPMKDSGVEWLGEVPAHWRVSKLSTVTNKIMNGYVGPTRGLFVDYGVPYLQSLHIKRNGIHFSPAYYVPKEWSDENAKSILKPGNVVIVQTGDIGQAAVVPEGFPEANCHALIVVSPRQNLLVGEWLAWVLNSEYGYNKLLSIKTGALHPHLNCGYVRDIYIPMPSLKEQRELVTMIEKRIEGLDLLVQEAMHSIALLQERRVTLSASAVTGKIDVRGSALQVQTAESIRPDRQSTACDMAAGFGFRSLTTHRWT